jgi:hypothetical protein
MASRKRPSTKEVSDKSEKQNKTEGNRLHISVAVPSLSGMDSVTTAAVLEEVKTNIYNSLNDAELRKSLDKWAKENQSENSIEERDYHLLKSVITEYLDSYILFGYDTKGERIVVQHANNSRDQDAIMEFLKTLFLQQQQNNFLGLEGDEGGLDEDDED